MLDPRFRRIQITNVRLVGADGAQLGLMTFPEAVARATAEGHDLILVTERAEPPVVRLGDYHKFIYEQEKAAKTRKRVKQELKQIQISYTEGEGDLDRKAKQTTEFLGEGHSVQIRLRLRGRQRLHGELAKEKLQQFIERIGVSVKLSQEIRREQNFLWVNVVKQR